MVRWVIFNLGSATSRHKQDFKHINDMYRLLQYKGYRFPESGHDNFTIPDDSLRTEGELEEEDKIVQGAVWHYSINTFIEIARVVEKGNTCSA